jgi:hypothetical protein
MPFRRLAPLFLLVAQSVPFAGAYFPPLPIAKLVSLLLSDLPASLVPAADVARITAISETCIPALPTVSRLTFACLELPLARPHPPGIAGSGPFLSGNVDLSIGIGLQEPASAAAVVAGLEARGGAWEKAGRWARKCLLRKPAAKFGENGLRDGDGGDDGHCDTTKTASCSAADKIKSNDCVGPSIASSATLSSSSSSSSSTTSSLTVRMAPILIFEIDAPAEEEVASDGVSVGCVSTDAQVSDCTAGEVGAVRFASHSCPQPSLFVGLQSPQSPPPPPPPTEKKKYLQSNGGSAAVTTEAIEALSKNLWRPLPQAWIDPTVMQAVAAPETLAGEFVRYVGFWSGRETWETSENSPSRPKTSDAGARDNNARAARYIRLVVQVSSPERAVAFAERAGFSAAQPAASLIRDLERFTAGLADSIRVAIDVGDSVSSSLGFECMFTPKGEGFKEYTTRDVAPRGAAMLRRLEEAGIVVEGVADALERATSLSCDSSVGKEYCAVLSHIKLIWKGQWSAKLYLKNG